MVKLGNHILILETMSTISQISQGQGPGNPRNARHALVPDIQLVHKLSMIAEQHDQPMQSMKQKFLPFAPQEKPQQLQHQCRPNQRHRGSSNEYKCQRTRLLFAASVVGDGITNVIGPFKNAPSQFHGKTIFSVFWCIWRGK
jgi:hypothetical protein